VNPAEVPELRRVLSVSGAATAWTTRANVPGRMCMFWRSILSAARLEAWHMLRPGDARRTRSP